jgi:HK97 family phage prohead protease
MKTEHRFLSNQLAEVKPAAEGESRRIEGMAFKYNEWSQPLRGMLNGKPITFVERILPGAADAADMSDVIARGEHSNLSILARRKDGQGTLDIELREDGLWYGFNAPNTTAGNDTLENVRLKNVTSSSFAFNLAPEGASLRKREDGIYERDISKMAKIGDVSPVAEPAYTQTSVFARDTDFTSELAAEEKETEPSRLKLRKAQVQILKLKQQTQ